MNSTLANLPCKLLTSHLVPEKRALLVHFLELTITNDSIEVLLSILLSNAKDLKRVPNHSLLDLVVEGAICLE